MLDPVTRRTYSALIFDFDGTLVDSDEALVEAFVSLGVDRDTITFGHAIGEELDRLGLTLDDYVDAYDDDAVEPFSGVSEAVERFGRWALCSNKHPSSAKAELARLGWTPEVALFAEDYDWAHKHLGPVLEALGLQATDVAMIGDSNGDLRCAEEVGCDMYWAGWNPRVVADPPATGVILGDPADLVALFR